jgi:hypothetical protein
MRIFFCILLLAGCGLFSPEQYNPNPVIKKCCDKPIEVENEYVDVVEIIDVFFTDTSYVSKLVLDTNLINNKITEYIYVADPRYANFDTTFVSVIEYVKLVTTDTLYIDDIDYLYDTQYVEVVVSDTLLLKDTIVEIEYLDTIICDNPNIEEILKMSVGKNRVYSTTGQTIRRPKGVYIENGKVKYKVE